MKYELTKEEYEELKEVGAIQPDDEVEIIEEKKEDKKEEKEEEEEEEEKKKEEENEEEEEKKDDKLTEEEKEKSRKVADYFYNKLLDEGAVSEGKEVNNIKEVIELVNKEKEEYVKDFLDGIPAPLKEQIELYKKGVNPNAVKTQLYNLDYLNKVTDEDLKNKETAIKLVTAFLESEGEDKEYIKNRIALIEDNNLYEVESKRAVKKLKAREESKVNEYKEKELNEQKKMLEEQNKFKKDVEETLNRPEQLWGFKVNDTTKQNILDAIYEPDKYKKKHKDVEDFTEMVKKPEVVAQLYYLYVSGVLGKNGKVDLFKNKLKSKVTTDIDELISSSSKGYSSTHETKEKNGLSFMDDISSKLKIS